MSYHEHWQMFIQCLRHQFLGPASILHTTHYWKLTTIWNLDTSTRYTTLFPSLIRLTWAINESNLTVPDNINAAMDHLHPIPIVVQLFFFSVDFSFERRKFRNSNMRMIWLLSPSSLFVRVSFLFHSRVRQVDEVNSEQWTVNMADNFDISHRNSLSEHLHRREFDYYEIRIVCTFAYRCVYTLYSIIQQTPDSFSFMQNRGRKQEFSFNSINAKSKSLFGSLKNHSII